YDNERAKSDAKHATPSATRGRGRRLSPRRAEPARLQQTQVQAGDQGGQRVPEGLPVSVGAGRLRRGDAPGSRRKEAQQTRGSRLHGSVPARLEASQGPRVRAEGDRSPED